MNSLIEFEVSPSGKPNRRIALWPLQLEIEVQNPIAAKSLQIYFNLALKSLPNFHCEPFNINLSKLQEMELNIQKKKNK